MDRPRQSEFLRLFALHQAAIYAYVRRLVPSRADADDVVQEVAVVLWEKFDAFREGGDFRAWALGVARFEVLAWLRDKGRDRLVLCEDVAQLIADETLAREDHLAEQRATLERCIEKLDAPQRALLLAAYTPKASMRELADRSGRSVPGFYQWLYRMRKLLLDCVWRRMGREVSP